MAIPFSSDPSNPSYEYPRQRNAFHLSPSRLVPYQTAIPPQKNAVKFICDKDDINGRLSLLWLCAIIQQEQEQEQVTHDHKLCTAIATVHSGYGGQLPPPCARAQISGCQNWEYREPVLSRAGSLAPRIFHTTTEKLSHARNYLATAPIST